jgi:Transposase zinc-ribbon domain
VRLDWDQSSEGPEDIAGSAVWMRLRRRQASWDLRNYPYPNLFGFDVYLLAGSSWMSIDADWLQHTYPAASLSEATESERAREQERACLSRLEALRWPDGPRCPKCGEPTKTVWNSAPRALGWRCENPDCNVRFHVLQAIPAMAGMHQRVSICFRAIYLLDNNDRMSAIALGSKLGIDRKAASELRDKVGQLKHEDPFLVEGIINGPDADVATPRRAKKRVSVRRGKVRAP